MEELDEEAEPQRVVLKEKEKVLIHKQTAISKAIHDDAVTRPSDIVNRVYVGADVLNSSPAALIMATKPAVPQKKRGRGSGSRGKLSLFPIYQAK